MVGMRCLLFAADLVDDVLHSAAYLFFCILRRMLRKRQVPSICRYLTLKKPKWCPPAPIFGMVWPVLYVMIGYASFLVGSHLTEIGPHS